MLHIPVCIRLQIPHGEKQKFEGTQKQLLVTAGRRVKSSEVKVITGIDSQLQLYGENLTYAGCASFLLIPSQCFIFQNVIDS